jgi:serine/threonine protein kinase
MSRTPTPVSSASASSSSSLSVVAGRYRLLRKLGSGSFGSLYEAATDSTRSRVAVKLEPERCSHPQLHLEQRFYRSLRGGEGVPRMHWYGQQAGYNVLVMQLLGKSLEDLLLEQRRPFSLKTVLLLADQMLQRVEYVHSRNIVHRDIKPDNFMMGASDPGRVYIIDFGLAKFYKDRRGHHIDHRDNKSFTGSARYASINTHLGIEQSRRDDLESLGYVLLYLLRGRLPWQGLKANSRDRRDKHTQIQDKKLTTSLDTLCQGLPPAFQEYLRLVRALRFADRPNYRYLRQLFADLLVEKGFARDQQYDWTPQ